MAHSTRYRNRRLINGWYKLGLLAKDYIDDLRFGRSPSKSDKREHFRMLYNLLETYENQGGCQISPFNINIDGTPISFNLNLLAMNDAFEMEDANCPCDSNCLTSDQVNTIEEKIIEITQTYDL